MQHRLIGAAWRFSLCALIIAFVTSLAFGQGIVTGSITGTVQDPTQGVIPGATITLTDTARNTTQTATTDSQGFFSFRNLPVGHYSLAIDAKGFSKLVLQDLEVVSGRNVGLPAQTMKLGASNETIQVEGATPIIETTTSQISHTFSTVQMGTMPLGGSGFDVLALFIPGVANNSTANFSNTNGASLSNNGIRGRTNNFQIDGQSNNDNSIAGPSIFLSNPDTVGEVQVVTNNFSAEYGRNAGSVVNYVTKSGTNQFHGTAFENQTGDWTWSLRNSEKTPYNGYCATGQAVGTVTRFTSKTGCKQAILPRNVDNRWGGTFGGPIVKDKAWFFTSYQNERQRGTSISNGSSLTPTPDGLTALDTAFPGNAGVAWLKAQGPYAIKAGNPAPLGSLTSVPVTGPNGATINVPMQAVGRTLGNNYDDTQVTGRGDVQLSEKNRFFARYVYQKSITAFGSGTGSFGGFVAVPAKDQQIGLDFSRVWSQSLVSQFRFSYSRAGFGFEGGQARPDCTRTNYLNCPSSIGFSDPTYSFSSLGLANNLPQGRLINNSQWQNNNTMTKGRHNLKFGGEYDRQRSPNQFLPSVNGTFTFYNSTGKNAFSNFIDSAAACSGGAGSGKSCSALTLTNGPFSFNFKEQDVAVYMQDDWRVTDNLTLNLGVRWDYYGQAANLLRDITLKNVAAGFWSASAPASVTTLPKVAPDYNNFAPNVGFAWTPNGLPGFLGGGKTVLRGGFRIAYDPQFYNMFLNTATAAPVVNSGQIFNVGLVGTTGKDIQAAYLPLIPTGANPGTRNQTRVPANFYNPYTELWSMGIEHQFSERVAFETRYVGNHAIGQFQTINGNPLITGIPAADLPSGVTACADKTAPGFGRVDCNFGLVRSRVNGAWSEYNGWQNSLTLRRFHNVTGAVNYTWGHSIDNVSDIFASTGPISNPAPQNPFNASAGEVGNSAQDFPNLFNTYVAYEIPWLKQQQGIVGHLLGGWIVAGSYRYQSGSPYTPYQNATNAACDTSWNANFIGTPDSCRPILSNSSAAFDQVGQYKTVGGVTGLYNVSTGVATTADQVRFIVNDALGVANFCGGDPFKCTVGRNTFRGPAFNANNVNMSLEKSVKLNERFQLQLRGEGFNMLNHQYLGLPNLNINSKNLANTTGNPFGTNVFGTGTRRSFVVSAHLAF